jgi:hypothetical protein
VRDLFIGTELVHSPPAGALMARLGATMKHVATARKKDRSIIDVPIVNNKQWQSLS